jgi:hypothetical protein
LLSQAAQDFLEAAPHRTEAHTWYADGMKPSHPPIEMYVPEAGWNFVGHATHNMWNYVQRSHPDSLQNYFVRVAATDGAVGTGFEFYARVFDDGKMTYRTESKGDLSPVVSDFVERIGVEPNTFDSSQCPDAASFNAAITELEPQMRDTERALSSDQAEKLASYLTAYKGGARLDSSPDA